MMNIAMKGAARMSWNPNVQLKVALFHSTPLLCLKKRTYWGPGRSNHRGSPRRHKIIHKGFSNPLVKQIVVRSINSRSDYIVLQSWQSGKEEYDQPSSQRSSTNQTLPNQSNSEFSYTDDDISCANDVDLGLDWNYISVNGKYFKEPDARKKLYSEWYNIPIEEYNKYDDSSSKYEEPVMNLTERLVLGLSSSGPLNLEDVKNAYRICALKWHPDRHHGYYKVVAEQKFKACNAAYETLRDKLALR